MLQLHVAIPATILSVHCGYDAGGDGDDCLLPLLDLNLSGGGDW